MDFALRSADAAMASDLTEDISKYRKACDRLRKEVLASSENSVSLAKVESLVESLQSAILNSKPQTRADFVTKMKFIGELIQLQSDKDPCVVSMLDLMLADMLSYLDRLASF